MAKYLVDLLSAGPQIIGRIPDELVHLGYQSGRIIISDEDPNLTLLVMLGCECIPILGDQPVDNDPL